MTIQVFGIRHHGPGCARALKEALDEWQPDAVVMELPADFAPILTWAANKDLQPPVGLLAYPKGTPQKSVVYPLAAFSPEWQALQWALQHERPVLPMDLPLWHRLALDDRTSAPDESMEENQSKPECVSPSSPRTPLRTDPIALLAEAGGFDDPELWWEQQVERRQDALGLFTAIEQAMLAVRDEHPETNRNDLLREAWMRKVIRSAVKDGSQHVAVICGAWHAPVLTEEIIYGKQPGLRKSDDARLLKGLPKTPTEVTWIPWTHRRLAYRSGYGAGISSPGWYAHVWESAENAGQRWVVQAARLLRSQDLPASTADVIEAARLADSLAALRDLRTPGLSELNESILSVMCHGDAAPLRLIQQRLEIGDRLGRVPGGLSQVPLADDVVRLQKSLRLKPSTEKKAVDLDLRKPIGLGRSRLLHRLNILGIDWGQIHSGPQGDSTFHEIWDLEWDPEFPVRLIEANVWGNTLQAAAGARIEAAARTETSLPELVGWLDRGLLADLSEPLPAVLSRIQTLATVAAELQPLLEAVPPLARVARYGNVRRTGSLTVEPILVGLIERVLVGLPAACAGLDDESARGLLQRMQAFGVAIGLLERPELTDEWHARLRDVSTRPGHGLIQGWCCRVLLDAQLLDAGELEQYTRQAFSPGRKTAETAAWIEGLLQGSALLLLHQETVWRVIDQWLSGLSETAFNEALPLLRRAFSHYSSAERRQMGRRVQEGSQSRPQSSVAEARSPQLHRERAARVLPVLAQILGTTLPADFERRVISESDPRNDGSPHE